MPDEPRPTWKLYAIGLVIYALVGLGAYGLGALISSAVLKHNSCPAATTTTTNAFTIYHPRHALTTGP